MIIKFHLKPKARFFPAVILSHTKKVLSLSLILAAACYFFVDIPLAAFTKEINPSCYKIALFFSNLFSPSDLIINIPLLFLIAKIFWKKESFADPIKLLIFTLPLCYVIAKFLKHMIPRYRPIDLFSHQAYGFHLISKDIAELSFPSIYACLMGAIAGTIACYAPKYSWHLLLIAFLISLSKVVIGINYLSDVIVGVIIGALISQAMFLFIKKQKITL